MHINALARLIGQHPEILEHRDALFAYLRVMENVDPRIRHGLLLAYDQKIVSEYHRTSDKMRVTERFYQLLPDIYGIDGVFAEEAVDMWMDALSREP